MPIISLQSVRFSAVCQLHSSLYDCVELTFSGKAVPGVEDPDDAARAFSGESFEFWLDPSRRDTTTIISAASTPSL